MMIKWIVVLALAILPIPATILGHVLINLLGLTAILGIWIFVPNLGPWIYTASWVNLVGWRILQRKLARYPLSAIFPMTTAEQNRSAAILLLLGLIGAIRSGIVHDKVGITLGLIGAVLLLHVQYFLFRPKI